jgi:hypothetical protein
MLKDQYKKGDDRYGGDAFGPAPPLPVGRDIPNSRERPRQLPAPQISPNLGGIGQEKNPGCHDLPK